VSRRMLAPLAGVCLMVAACSGGGSGDTPSIPIHTGSPQQSASGTMTIRVVRGEQHGTARRATYVSSSSTFATLWIDGDASGFRSACSLSTEPCTISWESTYGPHTFAVALDDSSSFAGGGNVLAENSADEFLDVGTNDLPILTLNGVAAQVAFVSDTPHPAYDPACEVFGVNVNCIDAQYATEDADGNLIQPPGNFDAGGACVTPTNIAVPYITNVCYTNPSGNDQGLAVLCASGATGTFTYVAESSDAYSEQPGIFGEVSAAQLAFYSLIYPNQSAYGVSGFPTYTCSNGTISAPF
jgi:hypothetical protein